VTDRKTLVATTKNNGPAQRRYGRTTKLLSYLSAAWCGFCLLLISVLVTFAGIIMVGIAFRSPSGDAPGSFAGDLIFISLICPFLVTFGVTSGRFLLRALPPAMSDQGGRARSGAVVLYAAVFVGLYMFGALGWTALVPTPTNDSAAVLGRKLAYVISLPFAVLWAIAALGLLIRHHYKRRAFLERPFVLFLRRFSTFSDRSVVAVILRQAAYNVPVVFLTPTLSRPGDWDLFLVGFAGLKWLHPWQSAPIVIRAQDDAWQKTAYELIRRAQAILLDASETSGALRAEAEMLDRAGRWSDTVCLRLLVPGKDDPVGGFSGVRTIDYTKSWRRALPRMAMGLLIVLAAAFFGLVPLAAAEIVPPSLFNLVAGITVIALAAYYFSTFVRPTINREAKVALKAALPPARPPQGIGGWLILPVIQLIWTLIDSPYLLLTEYWPIFRDGTWEQLTTPGNAAYHALWGPLLTFQIIAQLVIIVLAIATLVLLFRKSKRTRGFAIALFSIYVVFSVLAIDVAGLIPAATAAIWILYFIFSRRVKATFVR
jgi:hypothetical protein